MLAITLGVVANAQIKTVSDDGYFVRRGGIADTVQDAKIITDNYYIKDWSENFIVYGELDTVIHNANDTVEVAVYTSPNYSDWTLEDRDTVIVSSSHTLTLTGTTKQPYKMVTCKGFGVGSQATQIKWKYNLLIDSNR